MATSATPKCWEHRKCKHARPKGCPAYPNHGDICYMVKGTWCRDSVQGAYADKIKECRSCDFYRAIFARQAA